MADINILKPFILRWEGGFVNDPNDKGGATMKGVTLNTYRQVYGQDKTVNDLKNISDKEWTYIFKRYYWDRWRADCIEDQSIANLLVDWVWCSGRYGITIPQSMIYVKADGIVGPITLNRLNSYKDRMELFNKLWRARETYIYNIAKGSNQKFRKGWLNRLDSIKYNELIY